MVHRRPQTAVFAAAGTPSWSTVVNEAATFFLARDKWRQPTLMRLGLAGAAMTEARDAKLFQYAYPDELRAELLDVSSGGMRAVSRKKGVLKRILANVTMGNDMSSLFGDMVEHMTTTDLETKRMVCKFKKV